MDGVKQIRILGIPGTSLSFITKWPMEKKLTALILSFLMYKIKKMPMMISKLLF